MQKIDRLNTAKKPLRTRGRHTIEFFSKKNNCLIWLSSNTEREFALLLEFNDDVISYASQPESIFLDNGSRYTPDFLVVFETQPPVYYEVHMDCLLNDNYLQKIANVQAFLADKNEPTLVLIKQSQIKRPHVINLDCLYSYLKTPIPIDYQCLLDVPDRLTKGELTEHIALKLNESDRLNPHLIVLILIANKYFDVDHSEPLSHKSVLVRA